MNGLKLQEMEASEMLDVIHYFFEEDLSMKSQEQHDARNRLRTNIYQMMYEGVYGSALPEVSTDNLSEIEDEEIEVEAPIKPFNPRQPKGYVPPTPMSETSAKPFGDILDAPIS